VQVRGVAAPHMPLRIESRELQRWARLGTENLRTSPVGDVPVFWRLSVRLTDRQYQQAACEESSQAHRGVYPRKCRSGYFAERMHLKNTRIIGPRLKLLAMPKGRRRLNPPNR
jgi:hypothetical protein